MAAGSPEDVRTWTGPFRTNRARTVTMLNASLARWAYRLTVRVALPDNAGMQALRAAILSNNASLSSSLSPFVSYAKPSAVMLTE